DPATSCRAMGKIEPPNRQARLRACDVLTAKPAGESSSLRGFHALTLAMNFKHFVIIGVAGVFGLMVILVLSKPHKGDGRNTRPVTTVTLDELLREYRQSPKADEQFRNKFLEVTGKLLLKQPPTDKQDGVVVVLVTEDLDDGKLECLVAEKNKSQVEGLEEGQQVTIRGSCLGRSPERGTPTVMMDDCEVVKKLPSVPE